MLNKTAIFERRNKISSLLISVFILVLGGINQTKTVVFAGDILRTQKKLYSQNDEELIIRDFFGDRKGGFFVDVGCADYRYNSTTYYLEKHLNWSGIAVDALDEYRQGYFNNRPNTKFFNFIATNHLGDIEPFYRLSDNHLIKEINRIIPY